jgi:hypothetical protein
MVRVLFVVYAMRSNTLPDISAPKAGKADAFMQ